MSSHTVTVPADRNAEVRRLASSVYPPNTTTEYLESQVIVQRSLISTYRVRNGLLRFPTGDYIPANATVTSAYLEFYVETWGNEDGRSLQGEWRTNAFTTADYTDVASSTAFSKAMSTMALNTSYSQALSNPDTNIKKGVGLNTDLRLHMSGGQPPGNNTLGMVNFEDAAGSAHGPRLVINYTLPDTAFPQLGTQASGSNTTGGTTHGVFMPDGIQAGELLLVFIAFPANISPGAWPTGWATLNQHTIGSLEWYVLWKKATGSETDFNITTDLSVQSSNRSMRITGWDGTTTPVISPDTGGVSAVPNPSHVMTTWGTANTLWIAACAWLNGNTGLTAVPPNYVNGSQSRTNTTGGVGIGVGFRENATSTEDPGDMGLQASQQWSAYTIGIRPTGASVITTPTANYNYTTNALTISVTDASTVYSGRTITSWAWDWGDGQGDSGNPQSHTYASPGSYQVRLTVTDSAGETNSITKTVVFAPIYHRSSTSKDGTAAGVTQTDIVLDRPAGIQVGDLLLATITLNDPTAITIPTGWRRANRGVDVGEPADIASAHLYTFWKFATLAEPTTYTFGFSGAARFAAGTLSAYVGVDTANPFNAHAQSTYLTTNTNTAVAVPGITVNGTLGSMLIKIAAAKRNGSNAAFDLTAPASHAERAEASHGEAGNNRVSTATYDLWASAAGFSPQVNVGTSSATVYPSALTLALNPVGGVTLLPEPPKFRSKSNFGGGSSIATVTSYTVNKPPYTLPGDLLMLVVRQTSGITGQTTPDSSWTILPGVSNHNIRIMYKFAGDSEPSSYTFGLSSASLVFGGLMAFAGVDQTNPFDGASLLTDAIPAVAGQLPAPNATTTGPWRLGVVVTQRGLTNYATPIALGPPSGWPEVLETAISNGTTSTSTQYSIGAYTRIISSATTQTGPTVTTTDTNTTVSYDSRLLPLVPASDDIVYTQSLIGEALTGAILEVVKKSIYPQSLIAEITAAATLETDEKEIFTKAVSTSITTSATIRARQDAIRRAVSITASGTIDRLFVPSKRRWHLDPNNKVSGANWASLPASDPVGSHSYPSIHNTIAGTQTTAGTLTLNRPTRTGGGALQVGDLMVATFHGSGTGQITSPGWTGWAGNVLYKYVTGSEASSYTFTQSGTTAGWQGAITAVEGAHDSDPLGNLANSSVVASVTTTPISSINSTGGKIQMVVVRNRGAAVKNTSTLTQPAGWTELADLTSNGLQQFGLAYRKVERPGATNSPNYTTSDAASPGINNTTFEINPKLQLVGWDTGPSIIPVGNSARMATATLRDSTSWGSTLEPSSGLNSTLGDAFRTDSLPGFFEAGTWNMFVWFGGYRTSALRLRPRLRVWRSPNADGSGATEVTNGAVVGTSMSSGLSTSNSGTSFSFNLPRLVTDGDYLFFQMAVEVTTAATDSVGDQIKIHRGINSYIESPPHDTKNTPLTLIAQSFATASALGRDRARMYSAVSTAAAFLGRARVPIDKLVSSVQAQAQMYIVRPKRLTASVEASAPPIAIDTAENSVTLTASVTTSAPSIFTRKAWSFEAADSIVEAHIFKRVIKRFTATSTASATSSKLIGKAPLVAPVYPESPPDIFMKQIRTLHAVAELAPVALKRVSKKIIAEARGTPLVLSPGIATGGADFNLGAYLTGAGGALNPKVSLYLSNIKGEELQRIDLGEQMTLSMNNYRDHTWELDLRMPANDLVDPDSDYFKPVVDYEFAGVTHRYPLGLYRAAIPNSEVMQDLEVWDFTARSLESIVAEDMAEIGYSVAPNQMILATVKDILQTYFGIPTNMIDFPITDVGMRGHLIFDIAQDTTGCYWLNIINTILAAGAFTPLQTDANGRFITRTFKGPDQRTPSVFYGVGVNHENIVDGSASISITRDSSEFANRVLVTTNDPLLPPIVAIAVNMNPNSPSSIQNLNKRVTKTIELPQLVGASEAKKIAEAELSRRSGIFERINFRTPLDVRRGPGEVANVLLPDSNGEGMITGNWIYEGWTADLAPEAVYQEHTLSRLADI